MCSFCYADSVNPKILLIVLISSVDGIDRCAPNLVTEIVAISFAYFTAETKSSV